MEHKVMNGKGMQMGKEVSIIDIQKCWEVVAKGVEKSKGVAGSCPSGNPFGVNGGELVDGITIPVQDALDCAANGADQGYQKRREGSLGGIIKAKTTFGHGGKSR
jgi:hypothetical protein